MITSKSKTKGFTLLEALVGAAIFAVIALSAYRAFAGLMDAVAVSKARVAAAALANEKFEIIRNLPYEDVGLVAGLPVGVVQREETIIKDGHTFDLRTTIRSVDDPFDGTIGGSPNDLSPADYKMVDLDIVCASCKIFPPLKFTTLVAPRALETASANGALFIQVFDADGAPIAGAEVAIINSSASPAIHINETTDNEGWIKIVDAPPGINAYGISATKAGYSAERTYPPGGEAGEDPLKADATVVVQQVTQVGFLIDALAEAEIKSVNTACEPVPNADFTLTGTKLIGNPDILKYETANFSTNSLGIHTVENLEFDAYRVGADNPSGHRYAGANLESPFNLSPGEEKEIILVFMPEEENSVLIRVRNESGTLINNATVLLEKDEWTETKETGEGACGIYGKTFWEGLEGGTYNLSVSAEGYEEESTSVNIGAWQQISITLTAN